MPRIGPGAPGALLEPIREGVRVGRRGPVSRTRSVMATQSLGAPLPPSRVRCATDSLPTVIGIDASLTNTGIVCLDLQGNLVGEFSIRPKQRGVERLAAIQERLSAILSECHLISHVCMEQYGFEGTSGQHSFIGEGGGALKLRLLEVLGSPVGYPTLVAPNQLKKFVTGRGNAKKAEIILGVYKKWGFETRDDNIADAYGLAQIALSLVLDKTRNQIEREVIDRLAKHTELSSCQTTTSTSRRKRASA